MDVVGYFEMMSGTRALGWAARATEAGYERVEIEALIDGKAVATSVADIFREDLMDAGLGDGFHAFEINLSEFLRGENSLKNIQMRDRVSGEMLSTLDGSAISFVPSSLRKRVALEDILFDAAEIPKIAVVSGEKLALYATYSFSGQLNPHHACQIAELKSAGYRVVHIHAADNPIGAKSNAEIVLLKRNIGHDFGSWWAGLQAMLQTDPNFHSVLQTILLINDSFFGMVSSESIAQMEQMESDFVGLCDSYQVEHHIQSFCLLCKGTYLNSGKFTGVVSDYSFPEKKSDVIQEGEIELSRAAKLAGVNPQALYPYDQLAKSWREALPSKVSEIRDYYLKFGFSPDVTIDEQKLYFHMLRKLDAGFAYNPTHIFWREILNAGGSFVKKELLLKNPVGVPGSALRMQNLESSKIIETDFLNDYLSAEGLALRFMGSRDSRVIGEGS
jgi:hypothetical protein